MKKLAGGSPLLLLALAAGLLTLLTASLILAWPVAAQNNDAADLAPANLTAAVADGALTLNWEAPASDEGSVTGYRILRRRPRQGEDTLQTLLADTGTPATAYADYSATEGGVRYVYRVQALRGEDASAHSNFVAFDLSDDLTNVGPERAPSNLTAAVKQGALTLRWDAPAQHAESVTGYQVLRRRPLEGEKDLLLVERDTGGDATSWVDYDATQGGVSYVYRVKALRDGAVSHRSNFTKITLEEDLDPQPPLESAGQKSDPPIAPLAATELSLKTTGPTTAGATVTVDATGAVYLRFAPTGTTDWSTTLEETAAGAGDVQFELTGLDPNATYDVQTSQSDTFPGTDLQEATFTNRPLDEDFETLQTSNTEASGLWGNNTTLFVGQYSTQTHRIAKLYQYNRSTKANQSITTLNTISGLDATSMPRGIWSDGTYLWMVARNGKVEAIALADDSYAAGQSFDLGYTSGNSRGIWGNSSTIWVSYSSTTAGDDALWAFRKDSKAADADKDIVLHADNSDPRGIWSDGTTMWVIDFDDLKAYAYGLDDEVRDEDLEFDLDPDNEYPDGIWSDGATVWVSDSGADKIFAYYLPGGGEEPRVSDVGAVSASRETATATVKLLNPGSASATVSLRYRLTADTDWTDAAAPVGTLGTSAIFDLSGLTANAEYDLQASLDSAFMDGAEISGGFTNRPAHEDFETLDIYNSYASGLWGNNTTLYVGQYSAGTDGVLFEYNRSSHAFESSTTLSSISGLEAANGIPLGLWSDGTYLWMVDNNSPVEALALADDSYAAGQSFDLGYTSGNSYGIWGNSSTIWVSYSSTTAGDDALWAHRKDTKAADADKDIVLHADNSDFRGVWSDGTTMWVIDFDDLKAYAYGLDDEVRDEDLEFDVDPGNQSPQGMWSDGDTVWVSDNDDDRLYAYYLPVGGLGVTDVSAVSASRETATATVQLRNPDSASATVSLRYKLTADTNWTDASESVDTTGTSANFSLSGLTANASYDLQASLDSAFMDGAEVSGGFTNRPAHEDFDSLHSDNDVPWGLWGTADTLYVGQYEGSTIGDIMAYNRSSKAHAATISLSSISGLENTSHAPQGLWSDGTHLWMVSYDGVAEAILLSDNTHVPGQTITNVLSSTQTYGIWGNDSTIWISEQWDIYLRAFAKATKAADTTKDIDLDPDGTILISSPRGIWSDGETVWVLASGDSNAYAYTISSKARDTDKEFDLDPGNTTPRGIWSDGATVWVSDPGNDKLYAYYLPVAGLGVTDVSAVSASRETATATVQLRNPESASATVSLRYKLTADTNWTDASESVDTTGTSAIFDLSGLTANASYDLQASLDSTFMDGTEISGGFTNRPAHEDFDSLQSSNITASGLWGNSTTLYVGQYDDRLDSGFYTYNRSSHAFESTTTLRDISGFEHVSELPNGLWSDGTYLWMVVDDGSVEALALADNSHAAGQYFRTDYSSKTSGIWGNSSTIWVSRNAKDGHLLPAHRKDTKVADTDKNITLHADNIDVRAIWSDGTTMWAVDEDDLKAYAYGMDDGMRDEDPEFDLDPENESPQGMWSDGDTVWVSDSGADRIYAYYLPGGGEPRVSDVGAVSASRQTATATVKLLNPGSASTTVSLRYRLTADTDWTDAAAPVDATGTSANFSLSGLTANAEYDLQASLDSAFMDGAEISGGFTNRPLDEDFDTLWASGNAFPTGIWSDGTTMWVSDKSDDSFYAYTLTTKQFTKKLDVSPATLLSGRTTTTPHQIWSNGTYLWMLDDFEEEIFAMDIANESDAGEYDISTDALVTVGNDRVAGIWGSVDTSGMTATGIMYVADDQDDKIYAYDLSGTTWSSSTSSSFFTTLSAAGNNNPRGIWSDGATMWVIDDNDDKIYAYNASTKARDAAKDLALVTKTGESSFDMWSDGDILWVSNARLVEGLNVGSHVRLYAYYLPGAGEPRVTGVSVDTASVTKSSATVQVTLNNPDSDSQTVYQRHWAKSGSPPASASDQMTTTSDSVTFDLTGLSQGVEYQVDASLDSTFMTGVVSHTFTTLDVAGKPTGVTVTKDDKKLTVAWTAPTDTGGTAITGYKVQWKSGNQSFGSSRQHTAGAADTSDDITGLTNGTEYTVRVLATNSVGDGAWSDEKTGTPSTVPGKPAVTPSGGNTEINVSWTIDTGGSAITGYTLQYKESSVAGWAAADVTEVNPANDQTSYKIENLTNGTAYTVRLQATNANGTGDWSDEEESTPVAGPSVTDVDTEDLAKTTAKVVVTIANPQATSQTVHMRHKKTADANWNPARTLSTMGTEVKFTLSGLSGGTEYQAQASLDGTFATGVVSHTFITLDVAGKPTGVTVTKDDKKLTVAWTAPTDTGGTAITGYKVQWKSGNQSFGSSREHTVGATDTSDDITGLTNGREYTVRVRAVNSVGDGAWSDEKKGIPSTVPGKPVVTVSAGNGLLQVRWTVDDGGAAIDQHTVQWKSGSQSFDSSREDTTAAKQYTIPSLTNHTEYDVRVRAHNDNGDGAWSDVKSETPTPKPPPSVTIATEESEPIQGPFTFTVTFNEEVEDFHCYEDEPENPPDGPRCEIGAGYVGGALVDVKDFQEVEVNSAGEHVFSARVEDILTGTLAIFVNEGKAHAKAGGLGNTFGTLQVEVERPVLPDTPGVHFWSSTMTPAAIGGYLGYGSVGSQTGGSLNDDEFDRPGQIYTVKALLYNPAQGEVMLDLSHALPNRGERMILAVDGKWVSESNPEQFGVNEGGEALWTYHWHPADPGFEVGQSVDVRLSRQAPNILVTREYAAMSWDDPQDDSITGYRIERRDRDQGGGFRTLMADTGSADTSYTDRSVEPGGRYAYQVTAMNDYGESDPSGPVEADIPGGPPDRPTGLGATASEEAVALTWNNPEDDSITGYRIERQDRDGSDGFTTLVADTGSADTGYTDDTVEAGGRYAYRVTAINGDGESQASEPANADVPGGNPPDQPTGLGAVATGDAVALTWNNSKDDTITGYRIWRRNRDTDPPSQFSVQVDNTHSDATMYTDRNVEPDTRYAYRIAAINAWGESQWSKVARVRTPPEPTRRDG